MAQLDFAYTVVMHKLSHRRGGWRYGRFRTNGQENKLSHGDRAIDYPFVISGGPRVHFFCSLRVVEHVEWSYGSIP
jgi:hypothetical protein